MKTKLLVSIIIGVGITLAVLGFLHPQVMSLFCEEGFSTDEGDKCASNKETPGIGKQDTTKLVISIGTPIDSYGLAPVTTTRIFTSAQPITKISEYSFHPTNYGERQPSDLGTRWDLLPDHLRIGMTVVDEDNVDVIDKTENPTFIRTSELYVIQVTCGDDKLAEVLHGSSVDVPIKNGTFTVLAKNSIDGLLPNENGTYVLAFASFFKQEIELPDGAVVLSSTSETCSTMPPDSRLAYYDRVVFELGEK